MHLAENGGGSMNTTSSAGSPNYTFGGITAGEFPVTVTPTLAGYTFSPPSITQTTAATYTNQNFVASAVSTFVPGSGAFAIGP
jgi:hypothetical protein